MKVGIEIEAITNNEYTENIDVGGYHRNEPLGKNWNTQHDSSLQGTHEFEEEKNIEFVTNTIKTREGFKAALREFREFFPVDKELYEVMYFNGSTGCHYHFSFNKIKTYDVATFNHFVRLRDMWKEKIQNSNLSKHVKAKMLRKYNRSYARQIKECEWEENIIDSDRRTEFNINSEKQGTGMEWRAINLNGLETWEELEFVLMSTYDIISQFFKIVSSDSVKNHQMKETPIRNEKNRVIKVKRCVI